MSDTPLYNIKLVKVFLEYINKYYPEIDIEPLLEYAEITTYQLEDEGHWLTQNQVDLFFEITARKTDNPNIAREAGRYGPLSNAAGAVQQYTRGFITPSAAYMVMGKLLYPQVSRSCTIYTKNLGNNKTEIIVTANKGVIEKPYQCENRMGMFEGIAKLFTGKFATIEHPTCMHKGGSECCYIITWERSKSFVWKIIRNYAFLLGSMACIGFFFALPGNYWIISTLSLSLIVMGIILYSEYTEKKELGSKLENEGTMARDLLDETNTRHNNALLIQEIGQGTSSILNTDQLLSHVMNILQKRLDFERGTIMLADERRLHLVYAQGYGYNPDLENFVKQTTFHLDKAKSLGPLVVAFKEQRPILVENIDIIKKDVTPKTRKFMKMLGIKSFICVPIIYEGRSEGVLAVESLKEHKAFSQSDINLLMGIAPQIGISINNAKTYQQVKDSEERFRSLGENAPDIIYTLDADGAFSYINPAWEKILGHKKEDVIGRYFVDFAKSGDVRKYTRFLKRARNNKETVKGFTGTLLTKEGSERLFNISGSPNFDSKLNATGMIGTIKDITELEKNVEMLKSALESTITAMAVIVESKDPYTAGHQKRVTDIAVAIAEEMNLPEDKISGIRMAAMIHDIGKINIPAEILSKPGQLTDIEFNMIKTHPEVGYNILKNIEFMYPVAQIVYQHHEKINGSGYPRGLSGNDILLESRVIAVADVVEAMATDRPYRPSLGIAAALEDIQQGKGIIYDPEIVDACLKIFEEKGFHLEQV
ncbi:MAG: PAS domain S-box protein [Deltaproteobacteria bacterium]|nr:PAS domain S-box protein [Deltaproteobacteria bacterium]